MGEVENPRSDRFGRDEVSTSDAHLQLDLFQKSTSLKVKGVLEGRSWPDQDRFPVNLGKKRVQRVLWNDVVSSNDPLLVAGYASIGQMIEVVAAWGERDRDGKVRIALGAEPFQTNRVSFRSDDREFTDEATHFWLEEQAISIFHSAKILSVVQLIEDDKLRVRFIHGSDRLHAKIYIGSDAGTVGSSNFTFNGLVQQLEANARFERTRESRRYRDLTEIAENYWNAGDDWTEAFRTLLNGLLQVVSWREALARACAELLTGTWADRYLAATIDATHELWPSQRAGIAEALWVMENVGSVLVADATGSGKTRMGAHLVRAARDRLWSTGRVRRDVTVLVGPPAVVPTWEKEALGIGLTIKTISHGKLSYEANQSCGIEQDAVRGAQILAIDEAHNFLNGSSNRTRQVRDSLADNVLLFTATPISRGASDLLDLVGLLGPDNFDDTTLSVLKRLERRRKTNPLISPEELVGLRKEIQRFTVRRTKSQINEMVELDPDRYRDPESQRIARFPEHRPSRYETGETATDEMAAHRIRAIAESIEGLAQIERRIAVPDGLRRIYTDAQWLQFRTRSAAGLARHHVYEALRSSRAALTEHLVGTASAVERYQLDARFKMSTSGNMIESLSSLAEAGPPEIKLECELDDWLTDPALWQKRCLDERSRYLAIEAEVDQISDARELAKVHLLLRQFKKHGLVLAFDRHPITLEVLRRALIESGLDSDEVLVGASSKQQRKKIMNRFGPEGVGNGIAVCSDAMNEGLNLQRASCIVHLDLPTTLRVAEQRVGRIDRMNTRHDQIESWWPDDGPAFATRAYEKLVQRVRDSGELLGSNLVLPESQTNLDDATIITAQSQIDELVSQKTPEPWDGIHDALSPVRDMVQGATALVDPTTYREYSGTKSRVVSWVSPVEASHPWGFFAVTAVAHGAPRWMLVEHGTCLTDLDEIALRLRELLAEDPPSRKLDESGVDELKTLVEVASIAERRLLPRRMLRALDQMSVILKDWANRARARGDEGGATDWLELERLTSHSEHGPDPYRVAECWLTLVNPVKERFRNENRSGRYVLLRDIDPLLRQDPLGWEQVATAFQGLPIADPLEKRVSACILGIPG